MQNYQLDEDHQDFKKPVDYRPTLDNDIALVFRVTPVNAFLDSMFLQFQVDIGILRKKSIIKLTAIS